jgi:hypothetical protein
MGFFVALPEINDAQRPGNIGNAHPFRESDKGMFNKIYHTPTAELKMQK